MPMTLKGFSSGVPLSIFRMVATCWPGLPISMYAIVSGGMSEAGSALPSPSSIGLTFSTTSVWSAVVGHQLRNTSRAFASSFFFMKHMPWRYRACATRFLGAVVSRMICW